MTEKNFYRNFRAYVATCHRIVIVVFFRAIFTEKVHGQGKYLRKKNISKDFELKNFAQKKCLIHLEKIF